MRKLFLLLCFTLTLSVVWAQQDDALTVIQDSVAVAQENAAAPVANAEAPTMQATDSTPNPYGSLLSDKQINLNFKSILRGLCGLIAIMFVAWVFSVDRKHINWGTVLKALALQLIIAVCILAVPAIQVVFEVLGKCFVVVLDWTKAGSEFLFGGLVDMEKTGYVFALQILPTIIFFSALTSLFFYLGIIQKVVWCMAWVFTKFMNLSGAESLSTAGNIFVGQTEAPLLVKPYIATMTKSEIMLVMTAGMSTMAGGVLAAYVGMLGGGNPEMSVAFAKHLLSASVMAAPGAIAMAKMLVPQSEKIDNTIQVSKEKIGGNVLDAISNGTTEGLKLAANVAAMLLVFYALIAGCNYIFYKIGDWTPLNGWIANWTNGAYTSLSFECILSYIFAPIIWLTGVCSADLPLVGRLLGEKLILTEFVGYGSLAEMIQTGAFLQTKSVIISTYVLCGFANFASVGIQIGGIGSLAPNKKTMLAQYGFRALLGATLAGLLSAAFIGMLL